MTAAIAGWVRTLLALAVVGNVVHWVLPQGGLRRYAGLVVGLILLGAMVGPVWSLFTGIRRTAFVYPGTRGGSRMIASLTREQDADVAMVLQRLPGVQHAQVNRSGSVVTVTLSVGTRPAPSLRQAAVDTVEELTGTAATGIQVVELNTRSRPPSVRGGVGPDGSRGGGG